MVPKVLTIYISTNETDNNPSDEASGGWPVLTIYISTNETDVISICYRYLCGWC